MHGTTLHSTTLYSASVLVNTGIIFLIEEQDRLKCWTESHVSLSYILNVIDIWFPSNMDAQNSQISASPTGLW